MVVWGGLTNSCEKKRREKERYTHLNAEFQRIIRRDKKTFRSDQCKEIKENNKMGKAWDLFKKIRDIRGAFHAKMGTIKDRNGMDLTEAEDIKKRWQECTEELYKKDLDGPDNHYSVITHLEPDILECEVMWALGSITMSKVSGGNGIPVELFQILKMMLWKCYTLYASKFGNSAMATGLEKGSFHSNPKERQCQGIFKLPHICTHLTH